MLAAFAFLGMSADLDLLFGTHSTYSHSLGAVGVVAVVAALASRARSGSFRRASEVPQRRGASLASGSGSVRRSLPGPWPAVAALAAAYASHLLLDWVNTDDASPIGIMALWPFSAAHFHSGLSLFPPVSRDFGAAWFLSTNARAAAVELLALGPIAFLAVRARSPTRDGPSRPNHTRAARGGSRSTG